jgi:Protein of unknown function (DUF4238)
MTSRRNHYVPQWYQRRFLKDPSSRLFYLDLNPDRITRPTGERVGPPALQQNSPKYCFCEQDLYTTTFLDIPNDEIERFLFGAIDRDGADAVRAVLSSDFEQVHKHFSGFFEYLDAQKLRTPKGLDWIKSRYRELRQIDLMLEMQQLRRMHCTMWLEAVREIVSAEDSDVKLIITDHPVTIYHPAFPPEADNCAYPSDPDIGLKGSQTLFPLGPDHCLIFTNLEYAQNPGRDDLHTARQNARHFGQTLTRVDTWIRSRKLPRDQIVAINHVLKSRARRFIAAAEETWLYPEQSNAMSWEQCGKVLLPPRDELSFFEGETYIGYKDGRTSYQDAYGRTSRSHEYLKKDPPEKDPSPDEYCTCGSGRTHAACCRDMLPEDRMPSDVFSIRERNLMFVRAVEDILGLNVGKSWDDVRRELSDDQIKQIHVAFSGLWPPRDTDIASLLPRPDARAFRALYVGLVDARTIAVSVVGWLRYFDEVFLLHPFVNALAIRPEYSPIDTPSKYKEQTLKNVALLLALAPYIQAGMVHLIPDPLELNTSLREVVWNIAREKRQTLQLDPGDLEVTTRLGEDDFKRALGRLPDANLRDMFARNDPQLSQEQLNNVVKYIKSQHEEDPLALLQPATPGEGGAQMHTTRGVNFELGLFLAQLVGAAIYTDQFMTKADLASAEIQHTDREAKIECRFPVVLQVYSDVADVLRAREQASAREFRAALRDLWNAILAADNSRDHAQYEQATRRLKDLATERCTHSARNDPDNSLQAEFEIDAQLSIPSAGYGLNAVRRFLITFGRRRHIESIPLALLFGRVAQAEQVAAASDEPR